MSTNTLAERRDRMIEVDSWVRQKIPALQRVAAMGMNAEKLAGAFTWAMTNAPKLATSCPPETVLNSLMICAQTGLYPGPEGDAHLIPRWNGRTRREEATFQIGYPGLLKLAWRSDRISRTIGRTVRKGDHFEFEYGMYEKLEHKPRNEGDDPEDIVAVYFLIHFKEFGTPPQFAVMTREQIDSHMDRFAPRNREKQITGPWVTNYEAMALKTVCIKALKFAPTGDALAIAIKMNDLSEQGVSQPTVIDVEESPGETGSSASYSSGTSAADPISLKSSGEVSPAADASLCAKPLKGAPEGFGCGLDRGHEGECLP